MLNHVLFYIGVSALVLVGLIVAISAFVSIFASIRNSKAELAEQVAAEDEGSDAVTDSSNSHDEVGEKEKKEQ